MYVTISGMMKKQNKQYDYYKTGKIHTLTELLEQKAGEMPDGNAFSYIAHDGNRKDVSFNEFSRLIEALGAFLHSRGFREKHIAILAENSFAWILSFFAIVNSGNVVVAMDREMQDDEVLELAGMTDVAAFFCSGGQLKRLQGIAESLDVPAFSFEQLEEMIVEGESVLLSELPGHKEDRIEGSDPCCIFFTSGTTGKRRAVLLTNENIAADIVGSCALYRPESGTLAVLPFHHAFGLIVGVLMFLHYGECVFIGSGLKRFRKEMILAKPQTMMLVPIFVETMHKQIWDGAKKAGKEKKLRQALWISKWLLRAGMDVRRRLFREIHDSFGGNLDFIICGGAPLDPEYVQAFRGFGIEILNGYGTTECSPCVSVNRNYHHKDGTVGLLLPDSRVYIAEDGEIMVSGPHVMREYYNDKEATRESLTDGWYRTGDVGYLDEDGFLVLTGRKKNLIILSNGENISPELLEQQILRIQNVEEAVVTGDGDLLSVEIYAKDADEPVKKAIQEEIGRLNKTQPAYLRIAKTVFRDTEFEKTTTGKIKR